MLNLYNLSYLRICFCDDLLRREVWNKIKLIDGEMNRNHVITAFLDNLLSRAFIGEINNKFCVLSVSPVYFNGIGSVRHSGDDVASNLLPIAN